MKRLELGLTQQERKERDIKRRETNCFIAMFVAGIAAAFVLLWMGVPP